MESLKKANAKKTFTSVILVIAGLLVGAFGVVLMQSKNRQEKSSNENVLKLISQTDTLQSGYAQLQSLNEKYASVLTDKNFDTSKITLLDSLNKAISNTEISFLEKLDNIEKNDNGYDKNSSSLLSRITDGYRASVDESKSLNTIRNSFKIYNPDFSLDKRTFNIMQDELREKELEIAGLSSMLKANKIYTAKDFPLDFKGLIKQQDSVVNVVLISERKKNENLVNANNRLKIENDRLNDQLETLQNNTAQNKVSAVTNVSKENLNEQLSLAKADCYLVRADIKQTISNARQRKELLESALQILNQLTQSSNISVKQEAQEKLEALKAIAANNHD